MSSLNHNNRVGWVRIDVRQLERERREEGGGGVKKWI